ncbi:MAG: hydrolase Nlp/P60 [Bacteroidetes bacterium]|uniref:NlpC/P60 family protein n=1 Tax=Phaeocystidibacter marisrubri TaxID=1577780 RepID=A0A6L3ZDQ1_9FLAO|nr:C40 family peptidase [Phaeocystidibacter marisrubri]KAB2815567.1 NlpC/P60 family protein [Phaeocystidibacter marisrubri]TNE31246.1 MAG: hydrolase Nlp/P60 [Bacteroidota bacterium]GGH64572.1 hydrolase Nlp/P60 [Phaeocystidibacter marisrubri]
MEYGICPLSIVPMRAEPSDLSEMVNQALFGEAFKIVDQRKLWYRIRLAHDGYEGWIDKKQAELITKEKYTALTKAHLPLAGAPVDMLQSKNHLDHLMVVQGSFLPGLNKTDYVEIGERTYSAPHEIIREKGPKADLVEWAYSYINTPYLWGGRSPFGIDCSGFTQLVYRMIGHSIPRDASEQANCGEALSFIEEAEPGDLAFFDNSDGKIIHVGILLKDNYIIHASGKVRLDRLDQSGIHNAELRTHTHRLRVIKKIL